ncbi:hypothetical protein HYH03_010413 [Edaphochlamys debaryana]|uniref:Uncharacterized protein n=1 Tax=Edaphochlamys debaryana TaxID=47281 RepID=A0A836BXG5_9CHLO|nr:hypothetical protein HYH03_010413 [Edaphochlamys debaryana]|eukprot:KAG2491203.1 hypothetical protein HYH03_010413 [Edaphochlamys debaryana]
MEALCVSWHQRWPRASKLTLEVEREDRSCLPWPFACAPPEAFLRLTHLTVKGESGVWVAGTSLAELLQRVPGVQTLDLEDVFVNVEDEDEAEDEALASALSSLTRLEHLTLSDYNWWPCIQPGLAAQLKTLRVGKAEDLPGRVHRVQISDRQVASAVEHMICLEELILDGDLRFSPGGLRAVLDALAPSVRRFKVARVTLFESFHRSDGILTWDCSLADGKLLSVEFSPTYGSCKAEDVHEVAAFLEEVLLPSRVLGPRLPSLNLDLTLEADEESLYLLRQLGLGMWGLAARCDEMRLRRLAAQSSDLVPMEAVLAIARLLAVPQQLQWSAHPRLELPRRRSPSAAGSSAKSGGGGGEEGGLSGSGRDVVLTPAQAAPRVLERSVQRAMGEAAGGGLHLLLLGPAVSSRLVDQWELRDWVAELSSQATEGLPPQPFKPKPLTQFRALPSFGAVELACAPGRVAAVAEAGRRAGAAVLTAGCSVDSALAQVLGAVWSGEEAGGPGADVGDVDRLRWLLETVEAVEALLPSQKRL